MLPVNVRPASECEFDIVSLGEVMLRLDPGERRIRTARSFDVWEGGGEYNVARGLRRCFGQRAAVVTALADNEIGRLVEDFILTGGVDARFIKWVPYDGIGRTVRNGLNFTERGFGVRGAVGVSDRGNTAVSQMTPDDVDWDDLFARRGVRWLHTGGIFAALSATAPDVAEAAMRAAKAAGTIVSYDLNYRPSLWESFGGKAKAQEVNRRLARYVDVMIGNEEDFTACLGYEIEGTDASLTELETAAFRAMIGVAQADFPNFAVIATTMRSVRTATVNDWGAIAWSRVLAEGGGADDGAGGAEGRAGGGIEGGAEGGFVEATHRQGLEILDRVGGGDSFASGLIYGLMELGDVRAAVEYGAAHGALAMTTPGDTSMVTLAEVKRLVAGAGARVVR